MKRAWKFLLVLSIPVIVSCALVAPTAVTTRIPPPTPTSLESVTPSATTVEPSSTPSLVPSATIAPEETPTSSGVALPPMFGNLSNISQYFNPSGTPVKKWHDIPIMPQATAGQDFQNGVYSYRANATLDEAVAFYSEFQPDGMPSMPPATGSAGTGDNALHNATFLYPNVIIQMTSFDKDKRQVIVVISTQ